MIVPVACALPFLLFRLLLNSLLAWRVPALGALLPSGGGSSSWNC